MREKNVENTVCNLLKCACKMSSDAKKRKYVKKRHVICLNNIYIS